MIYSWKILDEKFAIHQTVKNIQPFILFNDTNRKKMKIYFSCNS